MNGQHDAPHELVGAYALDALDESERSSFERHLSRCADCRAEVDRLREATATLAAAQAEHPPAALRQRVLDQTRSMAQDRRQDADRKSDRPAPQPTTVSTGSSEPSGGLLGRRGLALAAAVLIGLAVVTFAALQGAPTPVQQVRIAAEQGADGEVERLLERFSGELTVDSVVTDAGTTARVVRGDDSAVLLTDGLPALTGSQTYQAWLIDADGPASAGVLGADAEPSAALGALPADVEAVAVSIEPTGGSEQPGDEIVAVVPIT